MTSKSVLKQLEQLETPINVRVYSDIYIEKGRIDLNNEIKFSNNIFNYEVIWNGGYLSIEDMNPKDLLEIVKKKSLKKLTDTDLPGLSLGELYNGWMSMPSLSFELYQNGEVYDCDYYICGVNRFEVYLNDQLFITIK